MGKEDGQGDETGAEQSSVKVVDVDRTKTLADLKILRSTTKGSMTRIKQHILNKGSSISEIELECRLGILESYFKQALNVQSSLDKLNIAEEEKTNLAQRSEIEELYILTKTQILSLLSGHKPSGAFSDSFNASLLPQQPTSRSKLERIKLATFSGKFSEFPNFIGIFTSLVHKDESLDDLQKFNYLRSCLSGVALNAVKEFDLTETNYCKALDRLKKRFDSKTLMFQEHLNGIMVIKKISNCSAISLRNLEDSFNTHISAMRSIGSFQEIMDAILIAFALDRVDDETRKKWEESIDHTKLPKWEDFSKLLDRRCQTLEARELKPIKSESSQNSNTGRNRFHNSSKTKNSRSTLVAQGKNCEFCNSTTHDIVACQEFSKLSVMNRYQEAKQRNLCLNCLAKGHSVRRCQEPKCNICSLPHHCLLHRFTANILPGSSNKHQEAAGNISLISSKFEESNSQVILATALVYMRDPFGKLHPIRALLDSASQLNFITEHMAQKLSLKKIHTHTSVSGIGKSNAAINYKTEACCKSRSSDYEINLELLILKSITNVHPEREMDTSSWKIPSNITLADPNFHRPSRIDLLIGADIFFQLLCVGQIKLGEKLPILHKTLFGWIVSGRYDLSALPQAACTLVVSSESEYSTLNELNEMVKKFWEMEEVQFREKILTREGNECEERFIRDVRRQKDGRFLVNLMLKSNVGELGDSLCQAKRRFYNLEKRFLKNKEVKEQYIEFMNEYERLGHMEEVPKSEISTIKYFAPHQFVLRPDSLTTKLRVVFDCSAKTSSNISLNDILLKGPTLQDELYDIILRFRCYKYVVTADISKMYRQILVHEKDRNYQCILWRESEQNELKAYRLRTVTYGTTSAPYLATRCLKYLADENVNKNPLAAKTIAEDFYMDDLITGGDSLETVFKIYHGVKQILQSAGFDLRKWCSNDKRVLRKIACSEVENEALRINDKDVIKTLGIVWNPIDDEFQYVPPAIIASKAVTKRIVLSELSQIFDPLGLINPIVVRGKIIMQDLWIAKSKWDESVPVDIQTRWEEFRKEILHIGEIKLSRYVFSSNPNDCRMEMHGFADASIRAYGCCVYIKTINSLGITSCRLLSAKSKIAPIKTKSLPKLELCAASLLVDLVLKVLPNLNQPLENIFLWTDSEIVIRWIAAHPSSWEIFVANRVSKIQSDLPSAIWKHVNSKANPADIISRGAYSTDLMESIWFSGPPFLSLPQGHWPKQKSFVSLVLKKEEFESNFEYFNNFQKTNRIFGYVVRFYNQLRSRISRKSDSSISSEPLSKTLTGDELENAFLRIVWNIQQNHFREEIEDLRKRNKISPKSVIRNLNPFLADEHNLKLLRVGGRLQNADIPFSSKCPLLLPKNSLFVKNFVVNLHFKNFHAGPQALLAIMRQRFWVIKGRNLATKVVNECLHCFKYKPKLIGQIMGNLPMSRVNIARPFAKTGVDFCGPFYISQKRRGYCSHKAYVAVFICFATKASHLEVVSDLSSQGFIAALKRFVARRGLCEEIHCDNGTNFVGARNELKELRDLFIEQQTKDTIASWCAAERIRFLHIPPRSPHFGGLWEAAVKSAKYHLYRTVKQANLTYEEFSTVIAEIECIMNSRPICYLSTDPNDEEVLTPGHFLIGAPLNSIPEPAVCDQLTLLNRWRRLTQIKQHFWTRWSKEYLLELQKRTKWQTASENIEVGTVVLVSDDHLPPQQWLLGRIEQVIPGSDSKIRVADIKTKTGILRRPIHRLAPLPKH